MTIKEIKETKEVIIRTQYIAEDGEIFYDQEQCKKYEESALFAIKKRLRVLAQTDEQTLTDSGSDEYCVEAYDIQTPEELFDLKRYLYLRLQSAGAGEKGIQACFSSTETRKGYSFDTVTYGHEVLIWWNYDQDHFWVYGDGSINGYLEMAKARFMKAIYPPKTTE